MRSRENQNMTGSYPVFEGVQNFRDCGGYRAGEGRMFRTGALYRSGQLALSTDADLDALRALGIGTIVDLRRVSERERFPSRRWSGFRCRVVERDGGREAELAPHLAALKELGETTATATDAMCRMYRLLPFEPMILALARDFLAALSEADAPVLVHCSAGKDRTGLLIALVHHLTGVSGDDLLAHYLESNNRAADAEAIARVQEHFAVEGRLVSEAAARTVLTVAPEFLGAAFDAIAQECGSLDAYLSGMIGLMPHQRAQIIERFTVAS